MHRQTALPTCCCLSPASCCCCPTPGLVGSRVALRLQAPANPLAMNVVMVGAECAPWSKTGVTAAATCYWCQAAAAAAAAAATLLLLHCCCDKCTPSCSAACLDGLAMGAGPTALRLLAAGGLGDVMQALPKSLAARGHRLMVVAPMYKCGRWHRRLVTTALRISHRGIVPRSNSPNSCVHSIHCGPRVAGATLKPRARACAASPFCISTSQPLLFFLLTCFPQALP